MIKGMYYFIVKLYKNEKLIESFNVATIVDLLLDESITDQSLLDKLDRSYLSTEGNLRINIEEVRPFTFVAF
jgi:hypothetical protein